MDQAGTRIRNIRERLPGETDEQYAKRLRGIDSRTKIPGRRRTVAQDKRDARKARNRKRHTG